MNQARVRVPTSAVEPVLGTPRVAVACQRPVVECQSSVRSGRLLPAQASAQVGGDGRDRSRIPSLRRPICLRVSVEQPVRKHRLHSGYTTCPSQYCSIGGRASVVRCRIEDRFSLTTGESSESTEPHPKSVRHGPPSRRCEVRPSASASRFRVVLLPRGRPGGTPHLERPT